MEIKEIMSLPITKELLDAIGFSQYDDEHGTWGNRRLRLENNGHWYLLQIIEYGDYPEENRKPKGFSYQGWFQIDRFKTKDGWDLITLKDIYKIIYLYHREWISEFKIKCQVLIG